ncbi:MAG: GNAT family N-acetyltransferase, partial [Rhodobacteraceae bacterium]|nr:GNAT family N-acetyltransferase [Paracoccaceae bacterium]
AFIVEDPRAHFIRGEDIDLGKAWRAFAHVVGMWALRGYGSFVFCLKGSDDALGMTGPWHPMDWPEREIGWTVWRPEAEGQGFAFEAASRARDFAFRTLGWTTAVSYIDPRNARSIALAERLGAVRDPLAPPPVPLADTPALVFRHPNPEVQA